MRAALKLNALLVLVFSGCLSEASDEVSKIKRQYDSMITMPEISIFRDHTLFASAKSSELFQENGKDIYLVGNLLSTFYDKDGNEMSVLRADSGRINEKKYSMLATGDVVLESVNGDALYTNELLWDNNNETVSSNDTILFISHSGDSLSGIGFESDVNLENFLLIRKTSGVYKKRIADE